MNRDIIELLSALEAELNQLGLWSSLPPSDQAMRSTLPFCYDTMPLQQWLQFIFIPRLELMIAAAMPLPTKISMLPIAEEAFKSYASRATTLLNIIAQIDSTLTGDA